MISSFFESLKNIIVDETIISNIFTIGTGIASLGMVIFVCVNILTMDKLELVTSRKSFLKNCLKVLFAFLIFSILNIVLVLEISLSIVENQVTNIFFVILFVIAFYYNFFLIGKYNKKLGIELKLILFMIHGLVIFIIDVYINAFIDTMFQNVPGSTNLRLAIFLFIIAGIDILIYIWNYSRKKRKASGNLVSSRSKKRIVIRIWDYIKNDEDWLVSIVFAWVLFLIIDTIIYLKYKDKGSQIIALIIPVIVSSAIFVYILTIIAGYKKIFSNPNIVYKYKDRYWFLYREDGDYYVFGDIRKGSYANHYIELKKESIAGQELVNLELAPVINNIFLTNGENESNEGYILASKDLYNVPHKLMLLCGADINENENKKTKVLNLSIVDDIYNPEFIYDNKIEFINLELAFEMCSIKAVYGQKEKVNINEIWNNSKNEIKSYLRKNTFESVNILIDCQKKSICIMDLNGNKITFPE